MSEDSFLPKDYSGVPQNQGNYMKFEDGPNRFRVLSSAITGYIWFEDAADNKRTPKRVKTIKQVPAELLKTRDNRRKAKYFWAFVVYNYSAESIQILELKQATLMRAIDAIVSNKSWGNPKDYDLVVNKVKTGSQAVDVEYTVTPDPKTPVDKGVLQLYKDLGIDLNLLYEGKDPFNPDESVNPDDIPDDVGEKH